MHQLSPSTRNGDEKQSDRQKRLPTERRKLCMIERALADKIVGQHPKSAQRSRQLTGFG
jgi:hypothetical protein